MWRALFHYLKRKQNFLLSVTAMSVVVGVLAGLSVYTNPALLTWFANTVVFGMTPFTFLTTLQFPLALLALSGLVSAMLMVAILATSLVARQFISIWENLVPLFTNSHSLSSADSDLHSLASPYLNKYLAPVDSMNNLLRPINDDEDDLDAVMPEAPFTPVPPVVADRGDGLSTSVLAREDFMTRSFLHY